MQVHRASFLGASLLGLSLAASPAFAQEPQSAELSYKAEKKWSTILPNETWSNVSGGIPIQHAGGSSFKAVADGLGLSLAVDTDGDGRTDKEVKGASGFLVFRADSTDGQKLNFAARFRVHAKQYQFAAAGMMRGKLNGDTICVIDQNNNGVYNEFGVDAMMIGKSSVASYLSKVVNVGGALFEIELSADGTKIDATPFGGEAGKLNLRSGFKSQGNLDSAVVKSSDGKHSFQLADSTELLVPAGNYSLVYGFVSKANELVTIKAGKMAAIEVKASGTTAPEWGGPLVAELSFTRDGEAVKVAPTAVNFYGRGGEEYVDFLPKGASPKFLVYDERTEKLLKTGRFGT